MSEYIWPYITVEEYKCHHCNSLPFGISTPDDIDKYPWIKYTFNVFKEIREHFNVPIIITSGYRCIINQLSLLAENKTKTLLSAHVFGSALDIKPVEETGLTTDDIYEYLEKWHPEMRIGFKSYNKSFLHIDSAFLIPKHLKEVLPKKTKKHFRRGARW